MGFRASPGELIPISTHVPITPHHFLSPTLLAAVPDLGTNLFFNCMSSPTLARCFPYSHLPTLKPSCHRKSFNLFQTASSLQFTGHITPQLDVVPIRQFLRNPCIFLLMPAGSSLPPSHPFIFPLALLSIKKKKKRNFDKEVSYLDIHTPSYAGFSNLCEKKLNVLLIEGKHHSLPRAGEGTASVPLLRETAPPAEVYLQASWRLHPAHRSPTKWAKKQCLNPNGSLLQPSHSVVVFKRVLLH